MRFRCRQGHEWDGADSASSPRCPLCGNEPDPSTADGLDTSHSQVTAVFTPPVQPEATLTSPSTPGVIAGAAHIPGYQITGELGRGGMGVVYKAIQLATKRPVALKLMLHGAHAAPRALQRFEREIDLAASLRHPNIVVIYDSGTSADGLIYYAMEYIEGVSLGDYLAGGPARTLADTLALFAKLCRAVHYAHQHGVIHRDLKPANVRIDTEGEPHVLDFGLAKAVAEETAGQPITYTGEFLGTLAYASPEQAGGDPNQIDVRSDVYSLGVILYEMVTGAHPYPLTGRLNEMLRAILEVQPAPPSQRQGRHAGDERLDAVALTALAKDPAERYQSAQQLADDVEHYLRDEPLHARPASVTFLVRTWLRRNFRAAVWMFLAAVVFGALAPLPRALAGVRKLCLEGVPAFDGGQPAPALVRLALLMPDWLAPTALGIRNVGLAALGFCVALLARARHRDEDIVAGVGAGLIAGVSAFAVGGMGWSILLGVWSEQTQPVLDRLGAASSDPELLRAQLVAAMLSSSSAAMTVSLIYALALCGASSVIGTSTAGCLLRRGGPLPSTLLHYLMIAVPAMQLTWLVLVLPSGIVHGAVMLLLVLLIGIATLGTLRDWSYRLLLPLYAAGLLGWAWATG